MELVSVEGEFDEMSLSSLEFLLRHSEAFGALLAADTPEEQARAQAAWDAILAADTDIQAF